ncbi:restriction endonuclease subunit S [Tropicibacter oceani]|uniref:Restriction endonuclease subunit S n=1 Tax=Tropicibacter oceani TaxID=3058420 RepID=A0ABY8QI46_9RHOB|nr:restriction endonuclease subunit S [Tropicibacter oceani]WGW03653.1 restriction endonuclease subunit S [Tropicibacter oceani]
MKAGWDVKKLGELSFVASGGTPLKSTAEFWDGDIPWYSSGELNGEFTIEPKDRITALGLDRSNAKLFPKGSLLVGMYDTAAMKMALLDRDAAFNQAVAGIKPTPRTDLRFVKAALEAIKPSIMEQRRGTRQKNLNLKKIKDIEIPLPPLEEQQRIVAVLDEAFEGLARARAHAEANLQNARELFESYLATAFSGDEAGWDECELNDHVRFIDYRGKTPPKTEVGIRLITAKNVKMGYIQREPEEFILESAYEGWMTRGFPKLGDVLFSTEAPLANVAQLDTEETVVIGQRLITMQADEDVILAEFLKFSLMAPPMQSEIHRRGTGATVVGIKAKLLKTVPLRFPKNLDRQRAIAANCQSAYDDMERLEEAFRGKLQDIDDLRQSLLQKAFAGELT